MNDGKISSLRIPFLIRELLRSWFSIRSFNFRRKERNRLISLERTQKTIITELEKAIQQKDRDKITVYNLALFTLNVEYDIYVLKMAYLMSLDDWDKKFMARQFSVLLYETAIDYPQLLGKEFRNFIRKYDDSGTLLSELNEISKLFSDFKKDHNSYLNNIRNYIGAHRDHNALEQSQLISTLDSYKILDFAAELTIPIAKLTPYLSKVMQVMINQRRCTSL